MLAPRPPGVRRAAPDWAFYTSPNTPPARLAYFKLVGLRRAAARASATLASPANPQVLGFALNGLGQRRRRPTLGASLFRAYFVVFARRPGAQSSKYTILCRIYCLR